MGKRCHEKINGRDHRNRPFELQKLAEFGQFTYRDNKIAIGKLAEFGQFLPLKRPIPVT